MPPDYGHDWCIIIMGPNFSAWCGEYPDEISAQKAANEVNNNKTPNRAVVSQWRFFKYKKENLNPLDYYNDH